MAQTIVLRNNPAYKEGSLLGYDLNSQSRYNPVPITLSRDSEAYVEKNGVLTRVNPEVPRIDSDGALLVEPQRTNLALYSEDFSNAAWLKIQTGTGLAPVVTANAGTAPDGTTTADRIVFDASAAASDRSILRQSFSALTTTGKFSVYLKSNTGSTQYILGHDGSPEAEFTITTEWQRFTFEADGTGRTFVGLEVLNGTSTQNTADILVWGFQVEDVDTYATSYIKTEGATATRSADVVSQTGLANLLGDAEGSLYVEASVFDASGDNRIGISDGTLTNRINIIFGSNVFRMIAAPGPVDFNGGTLNSNTYYKTALRYALNDFALYQGGTQIGTDTLGAVYSDGTLTDLTFDAGDGSTVPFYGKLKALAVYDTALDNTELANITTNGI